MTYSWYSSRGMRRGLIIALAALCLWMGWLIGWVENGSMVPMNLNFLLQDGKKKTLTIQVKAKNPNTDANIESHHKH